MKISKIASLCLIGSAAFIIGCGSNGNSSTSASTTATGTFIDAPVEGLSYITSSGITGVTDAQGHFEYKKGDKITFQLGSVELPPVSAQSTITPLTITDSNATKAANIAYVLQNLDTDGNAANGVIKLPPKKILDNVLKDINFSNETNVSDIVTKIKPVIKQKLSVSLPDVTLQEAKQNMVNNIDGKIKSLIVGKTYYIPVTDVANKHVETLQFSDDGHTLTDTWMEDGKQYTSTFEYSITNGELHITGKDLQGNPVNTTLNLDEIQQTLYKTYQEAQQNILSYVNEKIKSLIVGKTLYIPVTDVANKHVETLQFSDDGHTLTDTWTENGKQYKATFEYSITNGELHITGKDLQGNPVNTTLNLDEIQQTLYKTYQEAYDKLNLTSQNNT